MATPIPGTLLHLQVTFDGELYIRYVNPSEYVCRSFDCPNLPRALIVQWENLQLHKVAAFYETPDCTYREGYSTFNSGSGRSQVTGGIRMDGIKMIRSMMLGRNEDAVLEEKLKASSVSRTCDLSVLSMRFDSATLDGNATAANTFYEVEWANEANAAGGLSSNWTDDLPGSSGKAEGSTGGF
ncbi:hypothetical protein PF008_g30555 [Phytophthora fragariae]|uniref:Uncharacterized protein n=1 Tax=Phytophthora fragariae TaxID=53985 RepID=A0A6G0Q564_9STRA|nr:hypothetical protein PF008_g30555 [Phytophthora fragariae]